MKRLVVKACLAAAVAAAFPSAASAATTLGQAPPTAGVVGDCNIGVDASSLLQVTSAGNGYTVPPGGGVITEWRHAANAMPGQTLGLRVFRHDGGMSYTAVAQTDRMILTPGVVNVFQTRIPVAAGQIIGLRNGPSGESSTACLYPMTGNPADLTRYSGNNVDPPLNAPATYVDLSQFLVNVAATLEPDCDDDGFGDETQDDDFARCPPGPATTITKAPPDKVKTKRKRVNVTIEFSADEPGAVFDCVLDGKQEFKACTSPLTVSVKKGEHTFSVTATDAGGNSGAAATDDFKVKRKKKKR